MSVRVSSSPCSSHQIQACQAEFRCSVQPHTTASRLAYQRNQASIATEAALDGIYVIRTSVPAQRLDTPGAVTTYKTLSHLERDFRDPDG